MSNNRIIPKLFEFDSILLKERDYSGYQKLNRLKEEIKQFSSREVIPYLLDYIRDKRYLKKNGLADIRVTHILSLFEHYHVPESVPDLIRLTEDEKLKPYLEDICNTIGKFRTEPARQFLKKNLTNKKIAYRCAISLAYFPDSSGEFILIEAFKQSLRKNNFHEEIFLALVSLRNNLVWHLMEKYLNSPISEREKYKICNTLLKVGDSRIIPFLINFYHYYKTNPNLTYQSVKSITIEEETLYLINLHRDPLPLNEKMMKKIKGILSQYRSDIRVKTLFKEE